MFDYFQPAVSAPEEKTKAPESENINWRTYEVDPVPVPETDWSASKFLQSPAVFLQEEAEMAGEELVYEVEDDDVPGLSPTSVKIQLTYFDTTVSSSGDSEQEAMHNVALEMLKVLFLVKHHLSFFKLIHFRNPDHGYPRVFTRR